MKPVLRPVRHARFSQGRTVAVITLGCPKNTVDSETMLGALGRAGFRVGVPLEAAEIIIVNTCGFIDPAKHESLEAISKAGRLKRDGRCRRLIVAGCLVERYRKVLERELGEVDAFLSLADIPKVVRAAGGIEGLGGRSRPPGPDDLPRILSTPPSRAYLKIAEGCDNKCAYCAIPMIRGSLASRPREAVIEEARALARRGILELTLVAQDTTSYGRDLDPPSRLDDLLVEIHGLETFRWIRLLYLHPARVTEELLSRIASLPRVCPYFDIPFQHASGAILERMGRRGDGGKFLKQIEKIRKIFPRGAVRSSFIIGYPGEDRSRFKELLDFLKAARLDYAGAFIYSPEEGTRAFRLGDPVSGRIKERRWHRFMELQAEITAERNLARIGSQEEVLVEGPAPDRPGWLVGRTGGQAPEIDGVTYLEGRAAVDTIVSAVITDADTYDLYGRVL